MIVYVITKRTIYIYYAFATLINIAPSSVTTNACTNATSSDCIQRIIGNSNGKSNQPILCDNQIVAVVNIPSKIVPENIFPNNLNDTEIIFAKIPMMSNIPINSEIIISNNFTNPSKG